MSTPLAVSCPNCGAGLKLKSKTFVGKKVPCPKCKKPFLVEEPPEDEFMAEDDFGGGDDYQEEEEEEEQPRSKKAAKGGKGKKKSKGGGGSGIVLMIGGAVLGIGVLGGLVYGAIALISGMGGGSSNWTAYMPEDTDVVFRVRPAEFSSSPFLKPVMDHPVLSKLVNQPPQNPGMAGGANDLSKLSASLNLQAKDIDSMTIGVKTTGNAGKMVMVVKTKVAVDVAKLDQAAGVLTKEDYAGKAIYAIANSTPKAIVHSVSPDLWLIGSEAEVKAAIDLKGAAPARSRFPLSDSSAQFYVCLAPKSPVEFFKSGAFGPASSADLKNIDQMKSITLGINFAADAGITLVCNGGSGSGNAEDFKKMLSEAKVGLGASGGLFDPTAALKAHVKTMLDGAQVTSSGSSATLKMTLPGKIVSDGLVLAAPMMPMLEAMVAEQQKAASSATPAAPGMTSAPTLNGPGGITAYPGAVINAGNSAQNRIGNLSDQHNANVAAQTQEGAAGGHGAPAAAEGHGAPAASDPAAAMRLQQGGTSNPGAAHAPPGQAVDPAAAMKLQQGGAANPGAAHAPPGQAVDPAAAMKLQQGGAANPGAAHAPPGQAVDPAAAMKLQQGGAGNAAAAHAPPGNAAAGEVPAGVNPAEMMRRQQEGAGAAQNPNPNGNANGSDPNKPAPRSRSRRRTN
jgi:hypothetical protein